MRAEDKKRILISVLAAFVALGILMLAKPQTMDHAYGVAFSCERTWGTGDDDNGKGIGTDENGNTYIVSNIVVAGSYDAVVLKYDSSCELQWQKTWGSNAGNDVAYDIHVEASGSFYMTGETSSFLSARDAFIAKFDSDGVLLWDRVWGGEGGEVANAISSSSNRVYITGESTNFGAGSSDLFVASIDANNGNLLWDRTWGAAGIDFGKGIVADAGNNIYAVGSSTSFDTSDMLVVKFDSSGTLLWDRTWGTSGMYDVGEDIALTTEGNVVVAGAATTDSRNGAMVKIDSGSGNLLWARLWNTSTPSAFQDVAVDSVTQDILADGQSGEEDEQKGAVVARFDNDGNLVSDLIYNSQETQDFGDGIAVDSDGNVVVTGHIGSEPRSVSQSNGIAVVTTTSTQDPAGSVTDPDAAYMDPAAIVGEGSGSETFSGNRDVFFIRIGVSDGTKIVFESSVNGVTDYEIYMMNPDGSGRTNISNSPGTDDRFPDLSPDGTQVVFSRAAGGDFESFDIYAINVDGTNVQQLTDNAGADVNPDWSPDGTSIAFESRRSGSEQVYVMNPDGSNEINRSDNAYRDFQPEWSPDMTQIVFMSIREHPNQQIYVMNGDGTGQTRLTNTGSLDFYPTWSPDGELISFVSDREVSSNWQIFTMNSDGTQQTKLPDSNNSDREFEHHWSPDGSRIAVEVDEGHPQIYVYNSDGSSRINISGNSVVDKSPSWGGVSSTPEPPVTVDLFLHGTGPNANPPTLFLDDNPPTATTAKYRDSASVKFAGGNLWKHIGTWTYTPESGELTALSDLQTWIGLKNSDDQGTRFDLRAEVYKDGELVSSGNTLCITDVTRNPNLAKEVSVEFDPFSSVQYDGTDELSLKIMTRIGTNPDNTFCGGHSNAVGLRMYFDSTSRDSMFDATFS